MFGIKKLRKKVIDNQDYFVRRIEGLSHRFGMLEEKVHDLEKLRVAYNKEADKKLSVIDDFGSKISSMEDEIQNLKNPYIFEIGEKVFYAGKLGVVAWREYECNMMFGEGPFRRNKYTVLFGDVSEKIDERFLSKKK